jgi:hypothetical protein
MSTGRFSSFCSCFLASEGAEMTAHKIMGKTVNLNRGRGAQLYVSWKVYKKIN